MFDVVSCKVEGSKAEISIRVQGDKTLPDQIETLQSAGARNFVLAEASRQGIQGSPGISASVVFMPYNKQGQNLDELYEKSKDLDAKTVEISYYVGNFKIQAKV